MLKDIISTEWIKNYKKDYFSKDIVAGLSVAAIALPIGIAYSSIAGLPPEAGLYSCIFPMIAYAFFGSSRQLIVGPDGATCILIASSLAAFSVTTPAEYGSLSAMLAIFSGLLCVLFGLLKFGLIADFLSRPILSGYMNGLALTIIAGQLGKLFGYQITTTGLIRTIIDFLSKINQTNITALIIGISVFIFLRVAKKYFRKFPAPLIAVIIGIAAVILFKLSRFGIAVVGKVPSGIPIPGIPSINLDYIESLFSDSIIIVLISFCSAMLTSKTFAVKNHYTLNANKDFVALGMSSFFSGIFGGFVVSGADSRTAVNDSAGGKTQLVSIVASFTIILFVIFFTSYLEFLPVSVLSAIIISATLGLIDISYLKKLYAASRGEFWLSVITFLSVISIGVVKAVLIAVSLSLIGILKRAVRPKISILGRVEGIDSFQDIEDYEKAVTLPGILVVRFEASMFFFNSDYFTQLVKQLINVNEEKVRYLVLDASPVILMDITSAETIVALQKELKEHDCEMHIARVRPNVRNLLLKIGFQTNNSDNSFAVSVHQCIKEITGNFVSAEAPKN